MVLIPASTVGCGFPAVPETRIRCQMRAMPDSIDFQSAAPVAQGIEQDGPNVKVGGSIPSGGTNQEVGYLPQIEQPAATLAVIDAFANERS
jgi:hypothetical protein